jgi:hypothetical protein
MCHPQKITNHRGILQLVAWCVQSRGLVFTVHPIATLFVEPEYTTMKTFSPSPLKCVALMLSIGISLGLMDAISTGFASPQASSQSVVQLPMVTVHGKRLASENAVVAEVSPSASSSLPTGTKL